MQHQQQRNITLLHVVFSALVALAFTVLGALSLTSDVALLRSQSVAPARVVESRMMKKRRGGVSFELRYAFSPTPGAPEIGRCDFLGRSNLWSTLPEADWRAATATNQVTVRFDPNHPGNNAPDVSLPSGWRDSSTLLVLGLVFGGLAFAAERRRRLQTPAIDGPPADV